MRLDLLHKKPKKAGVLASYLKHLKSLMESTKYNRVLSERKITIEIDDSDENPKINSMPVIHQSPAVSNMPSFGTTSKEEFIKKAQAIGDFNDPTWVSQLVNGMKQVGVQGLDHVASESQPVSRNDIKRLIGLLVDLVNNRQ